MRLAACAKLQSPIILVINAIPVMDENICGCGNGVLFFVRLLPCCDAVSSSILPGETHVLAGYEIQFGPLLRMVIPYSRVAARRLLLFLDLPLALLVRRAGHYIARVAKL